MKKSYDRQRAKRLVPLLEAIAEEIADRVTAIRTLEKRAKTISDNDAQTTQYLDLMAELATHRRELRLAAREFELLGCVVDEDRPTRILIPGVDGNFDGGFRWDAGDSTVHRLTSEPTAN